MQKRISRIRHSRRTVLLCLLCAAAPAHGASFFWKSSVSSGNWATPSNWSVVGPQGIDNAGPPTGNAIVDMIRSDGTNRAIGYDYTGSPVTLSLLQTGLIGGSGSSTIALNMSANALTLATAYFGYSGAGGSQASAAFNQSGGTFTIASGGQGFFLGLNSTDKGTVTLSGSAIMVASNYQVVGYAGTGVFTQSGGTNTINPGAFSLFIGELANSNGTYNLSGGTLNSSVDEDVGLSGNGTFNQTGGVNTIAAGHYLNISVNPGSSGTYLLSGGTLSLASPVFIGGNVGGTGGPASLTVSGSGVLLAGAIEPYGSNPFTLADGGTVITGGFAYFLGSSNANIHFTGGSLTITGGSINMGTSSSDMLPNSLWSGSQSLSLPNGSFTIGNIFRGSLTLAGTNHLIVGTPAANYNLVIGSSVGATGSSLSVTSPLASVVVNGTIIFGGGPPAPGSGSLTLSAGAVTVTGVLRLPVSPSVITLSGGTLHVSTLDLSPNPAALAWSAGSLDLIGGSLFGISLLTIPAPATLSGYGSVLANLSLAGTLRASSPSDPLAIHGTTSGTGAVILSPDAFLVSDSLLVNSLALNPNSLARIRPGGGPVRINSFSLSGSANNWSATLDLTSNPFILATTNLTKTALLSALANQITSGFHHGDWHGTGITSSSAAADPAHYAVGLFDNAILNLATFGNQPVDANSLLVSLAHLGDANASGIVDIQDQSLVTNHWQSAQTNWAVGDLNLDGFVDLQDLTLVTNNWQQSSNFSQFASALDGGGAGGGIPVTIPEPASLALFLAGAALLPRRRMSATPRHARDRSPIAECLFGDE